MTGRIETFTHQSPIPILPTPNEHNPDTAFPTSTSLADKGLFQGLYAHFRLQLLPVDPICTPASVTCAEKPKLFWWKIGKAVHTSQDTTAGNLIREPVIAYLGRSEKYWISSPSVFTMAYAGLEGP